MRVIFAIAVLIMPLLSRGQSSGFLGSKHSLAVRIYNSPTLDERERSSGSAYVTKRKINYMKADFMYSYSLFRKVELMVGYHYTNMLVLTPAVYKADPSDNAHAVIDGPRVRNHGFTADIRYYRKGHISPLGKYIGLSARMGSCEMPAGTSFRYTPGGSLNSGSVVKIQTMGFYVVYGQNYPVIKKLSLSFQLSFPLFFSAGSVSATVLDMASDSQSTVTITPNTKTTGFSRLMGWSALRYSRASLDVGLRFHF